MTDNEKTFEYLQAVRSELASEALPPSFAKLYSQYTRMKMNQPSLKGWRVDEFSDRLADAVTLLDAGLAEREIGGVEWRNLLKRSGELLEWLSHPEINVEKLPLRLLSAGVYQLAGYPALSMGLLNNDTSDSSESRILIALLKGDFPKVLSLITDFWSGEITGLNNNTNNFNEKDINIRVIEEIIRSLGVLCAYMRWDERKRLEQAQKKLHDISEIMIYGTDNYSWLLSKIVSEVVGEFINGSMRGYVQQLKNGVSDHGKSAFERYLRSNYQSRKSLAWYSQVQGIERLLKDGSFALCTPTGSGKTTIAELAIIQSIFQDEENILQLAAGSIVMYLVPSRALATEVEAKMKTVLGNLGSYSVKVTGLYGGVDWGPTDAWINTEEPTVLICTYEKGEALIRFLGPLFLNRVSLVVIDEAHSVQFNGSNYDGLRTADDRSLRLEMLTNRILRYLGEKRVIALSAVAEENKSLAQWISGKETANPVISNYRSTRQLIGRLEWLPTGLFEIRYDSLNGNDLGFSDNGNKEDVPFIQNPFKPFPVKYKDIPKSFINEKNGVSKRQRPYLFWAAMQLVQPDELGIQHSVLISITQHVSGYAEDFLNVINKILAGKEIPNFFSLPTDPIKRELFEKCLNACEDYFGIESNEFQLLKMGIVVHHGSMPGLLARLLIELIQKRIVFIAIATSTLSEGVNLPFETVIIPTLMRRQETLPVSEFKNLVGRAGRPGSGTEGRTLIFLESKPLDYSSKTARKNYFKIVDELTKDQIPEEDTPMLSPLGALLRNIAKEWSRVSNSTSQSEFFKWLETVVPLETPTKEVSLLAEESLDSLDGYLISILVEEELMVDKEYNKFEIEDFLTDVWRKTYANYVMSHEELWGNVFVTRGSAIKEKIYPDSGLRRRLYRTSVSPRFGKAIIKEYTNIAEHLKTGTTYTDWTDQERLTYINHTVELISMIGKFKVPDSLGRGKNPPAWNDIMTWWLNPKGVNKKPTKKQVSDWIKFVKSQFEYKFNWGLGTVLALILDDTNDGILQETKIEDWPKTELPWIVFWLKELFNWGTLDPVVAMILANGIEYTRANAEKMAEHYYETCNGIPVDEILNPRRIKNWLNENIPKNNLAIISSTSKEFRANLSRDFTNINISEWRVIPIMSDNYIYWIDPAGYELAKSEIPDDWVENKESRFDFILNINTCTVIKTKYL